MLSQVLTPQDFKLPEKLSKHQGREFVRTLDSKYWHHPSHHLKKAYNVVVFAKKPPGPVCKCVGWLKRPRRKG